LRELEDAVAPPKKTSSVSYVRAKRRDIDGILLQQPARKRGPRKKEEKQATAQSSMADDSSKSTTAESSSHVYHKSDIECACKNYIYCNCIHQSLL